jgi:hypothetical protein
MTREQGKQLQRECREIAEPYLEQLKFIYDRANFTRIYSPSEPLKMPQIIWPNEEMDMITSQMKVAVNFHMIKRMEEWYPMLPKREI